MNVSVFLPELLPVPVPFPSPAPAPVPVSPNRRLICKGIGRVLHERKRYLNPDGSKPVLYCNSCKAGAPHSERIDRTMRCCCRFILSQEPDFVEQRPWLEEVVIQLGFNMIYYPKYHCELNFIEIIWGWMKRVHRENCTYNLADLENEESGLAHTMNDLLPISFVRRTMNHCLRWMAFYRKGLTGPLLEYAVKKFKQHRQISAGLIQEIRESYDHKMSKSKSMI